MQGKLVDWEIEEQITSRGIVTPYCPRYLQPNSLDIRIGNTIYEQTECDEPYNPRRPDEYGWSATGFRQYVLEPNQFILADTLEYFNVPNDIYLELHGKSSLARLGLTIHQTGGLIDSGFRGTITLEIKNESRRGVVLYPNMVIGQVTFEKVSEVRTPYCAKHNAKYLEQNGPTLSRYRME